MFVITNKMYYIARQNGMYQPVSRLAMAAKFSQQQSAANVINQLPKVLRGKGYVVEEVADAPLAPLPSPKRDGISWKSAPLLECGILEVEEMARKLTSAVDCMNELGNMIVACREGIRQQNKIQEDLLHAIEYESGAKGNAAHLFALMQKCRKTRRAYKDMFDVLDGLTDMTPKYVQNNYLATRQQILDKRVYVPRSEEVFS